MELTQIFKSICDNLNAPVAICDLSYNIVYENAAAIERYNQGKDFVGKNIECFFSVETLSKIYTAYEWFKEDENNNSIFIYHNEKDNTDGYINAIRDENKDLIAVYSYEICRNCEIVKPFDID